MNHLGHIFRAVGLLLLLAAAAGLAGSANSEIRWVAKAEEPAV